MNNTKFGVLILSFVLTTSTAFAQSSDTLTVSVRDVTSEYAIKNTSQPVSSPTPSNPTTPTSGGCLPTDPWCGGSPGPINPDPFPGTWPNPYPSSGINWGTVLSIGNKVWQFIVDGKPKADVQSLKASVLPSGANDWKQFSGWSKPVSKVFRVEFKNIFGKPAGGFDYRLTFIYGGGYRGHGKYIGQIAFAPANLLIKTDRSLNVKAEILDALNFGTEEDPIAGVQLLITWNSSTTLKYTMNSIEYFLYGTGEIEDISGGTLRQQ